MTHLENRLMKGKSLKKNTRLANLSFVMLVFVLLSFLWSACSKKNILTANETDGLSGTRKEQSLYLKMESYTPILIDKGVQVLAKELNVNGHTSAVDNPKGLIRFSDYKEALSDVVDKMYAEGLKVDILKIGDPLFQKLQDTFVNVFESQDNWIQFTAGTYERLDNAILGVVAQAKTETEKSTIAYYGSLFKSVFVYADNHPELTEKLQERAEQLSNKNPENITLTPICRKIKTGLDRVKCRLKYIGTNAAVGAVAGSIVPGKGNVIGAAAGVVVGSIAGRCQIDDCMP